METGIKGRRWWSFALVAILGILLGQGTFTFSYAKGTSYLSDDPTSCNNCHVMRDHFDAWQHSSHARFATCNDCHTPHTFPGKYIVKGINGFNHSLAFTLNNFHDPIRIRQFNANVVQHNCEYCHGEFTSQINGPHTDEPTICVSCHGDIGHPIRQ
jgi:cytochrome c nitrite reductase small subunit